MTYYIEVLGTKADPVPIERLRQCLKAAGLNAVLEDDESVEDDWEEILLSHPDEYYIAKITRESLEPEGIGESILEEYGEKLPGMLPRSASEWVRNSLTGVQVLYSVQVLSGVQVEDGWDSLHAVLEELRSAVEGIIHAESEGFWNAEGCCITWEFRNSISGPCPMAVLNADGTWDAFEMELSDESQRAAFLGGQVPAGVRIF